jgi:hypothetical protein
MCSYVFLWEYICYFTITAGRTSNRTIPSAFNDEAIYVVAPFVSVAYNFDTCSTVRDTDFIVLLSCTPFQSSHFCYGVLLKFAEPFQHLIQLLATL